MPVKKAVGWAEIDEVIAECTTAQDTDRTAFPDRTYEDGIRAGIEWVTGLGDSHPLEKDE